MRSEFVRPPLLIPDNFVHFPEKNEVCTICPTDEEWPEQLNELGGEYPPDRLFRLGLPLDPAVRMVAVVGTRRPTVAGMEIAEELTRGLVQAGFVIVSGLAVGIDAIAHKTTLDAGGRTVAVIGCGLDQAYPNRNNALRKRIMKNGTLISEYELGIRPRTFTFPQRNRIIAGLSCGVVVVEGGYQSGALNTARHALQANREVFAVPGSVRNPMAKGPNALIKSSQAALVTCLKDITDELAPGLVWSDLSSASGGTPVAIQLDGVERSILHLLDDVPVTHDDICNSLNLEPGRSAVALSRMEVRGLVRRRGAAYVITGGGTRIRSELEERRSPVMS
ncbi:MAG: processing protein [Actinomycetota bacterium]|jgi:DNA processing protein|nr:processing protein [Actinomycetota bacterium]